jgi:hypothetical protein
MARPVRKQFHMNRRRTGMRKRAFERILALPELMSRK